MTVDRIQQRPRCELRFAFKGELEHHFRIDHTPATADDPTIPAALPAAGIARFAGGAGDTIVALGTRGRGVLGNAVLGSVARRVVHMAACPVLAVPPAAGRSLPRRRRAMAWA